MLQQDTGRLLLPSSLPRDAGSADFHKGARDVERHRGEDGVSALQPDTLVRRMKPATFANGGNHR
jgi:hypothetical protein